MEDRQGTHCARAAGNGAAKDLPTGGRCVLLVHPRRGAPRTLAETLRRRGVEVCVEREPVLALAELARCMIEHRERSARRHASFHDRGRAQAAASPPPLIFIVADPDDFADAQELLECAARSMPSVALAVFEEGASPSLRMIRAGARTARAVNVPRAGPARQAARAGAEESEPPQVVVPPARSARPALRLASHDDPARFAAPEDGADRAAAGNPLSLEAPAADEARPEPLITDEELAMLLGDDEGPDETPRAGGAA